MLTSARAVVNISPEPKLRKRHWPLIDGGVIDPSRYMRGPYILGYGPSTADKYIRNCPLGPPQFPDLPDAEMLRVSTLTITRIARARAREQPPAKARHDLAYSPKIPESACFPTQRNKVTGSTIRRLRNA